jgi:protein tyrosine/serine phosphatase
MSLPIRFEKVDSRYYRSGRPSPRDYEELAAKVRSIVNLEGHGPASAEVEACRPYRIEPFWFPISIEQIYMEGVPQPLLDWALDSIGRLPAPVLIHCQHGEDRTGMAVAIIRIRSGWSYGDAIKEAVSHGYRQLFNRGLDEVLERYSPKDGEQG